MTLQRTAPAVPAGEPAVPASTRSDTDSEPVAVPSRDGGLPPDVPRSNDPRPMRQRIMGWSPTTEWARVRNPSGLVSYDEATGEPRIDASGESEWSQRGEVISLAHYRHDMARLLLANGTLLPCTAEDAQQAPRCAHGRRFSDEQLAEGCNCGRARRRTSI